MTRFTQTLCLPGNEITAMTEQLAERQILEQSPYVVLGGPYLVTFRNNFTMRIQVVNSSPPTISIVLRDHNEHVVARQPGIDGELDQDYILMYQDDTYTATILRGANTTLLDAEVVLYCQQGGVRCPFCGDNDLHQGRLQTDAGIAWGECTCCACNATWQDQYILTDICRDITTWSPPQTNIIVPPA